MENFFAEERWALINYPEDPEELRYQEEDEEEALSLSDLPLIHQSTKDNKKEEQILPPRGDEETHQDFHFCSLPKESHMCTADQVFFQGQILPLRHSLVSQNGLSQFPTRPLSRSQSMDKYYSGRLLSSRSSSTSSHQSSGSSGGGLLPPRNQFHSHQSPSPQLHFSSYKQGKINSTNHRNSVKKPSMWNILKLGLVATPPEMAFHDLKKRNNNSSNCRNFGSRNSTSSSSSLVKKKMKAMALPLLGGCKCSSDAVDTVASKVVIIKRSASESDVEAIKPKKMTKKQLSHHRTFEWLRQLSVEDTDDET